MRPPFLIIAPSQFDNFQHCELLLVGINPIMINNPVPPEAFLESGREITIGEERNVYTIATRIVRLEHSMISSGCSIHLLTFVDYGGSAQHY
jgi:hypothetical protein